MLRVGTRWALAVFVLASASAAMSGAALAQWGWGYDDRSFRRYPYPYQPQNPYRGQGPRGLFWDDDDRPRRPSGPSRRSGGARPEIAPLSPTRMVFPSNFPAGSVVIDHKGRQLFLVLSPTDAFRYPISVGREGFTWTGSERISKTVDWPDWYPPDEMRARDRSLPVHMSGGLKNPLGAKALYLGKTLYRIHGTNDPSSIGRAASSGCFRMLNGHVIDLARRVEIGTLVTVVSRLPPDLERTVVDQLRGHSARAPAAPAAAMPPPAPAARLPAAAPAPRPPTPPGPPASKPSSYDEEEGPAGEGLGGRERHRS
jgi:lipoprotein-anchoring transpeptidase ErfK/SrfK